jgi:TetR/AcrR family transcriptional regulator, cholesterol catabolism regulator
VARSAIRRRQVLDAAAKVFRNKGYEAASIRDIAEELGILKGSLYYYIKSKDDLLFEILTDMLQQLDSRLEPWRLTTGSPIARLESFVLLYIAHVIKNHQRYWLFFQDVNSLSNGRRKEVIAMLRTYDADLTDLLSEGVADGSIRASVDPRVAGRAIFGMLNWTSRWYSPRGGLTAAHIGVLMADMVLASVAEPRAAIGGQLTSAARLAAMSNS